jgi:DNA-binding SARP family transcriptional activator
VDVKVLGSLSVSDRGVEASPTAPKLRQLLALLVLNDSHVVPVLSLVAELWHEAPPRSSQTTLQTYVLQLRRAFARSLGVSSEEITRDLLQTTSGGYRLNMSVATFDLRVYRSLETVGNDQLRARDDHGAVRTFTSALALWRGDALLDVDHGCLLEAEVAQLEQSRLTTMELLLDTELRLGHHREVLSELASLVVRWRFHEDLHALYMLALHRSGYRARALEVFSRLRAALHSELGIEPSPKLRQLQRAILTSDSALDQVRHILTVDLTPAG